MLLLSAAVRGPIQRNINLKAFYMEYAEMVGWRCGGGCAARQWL